MHIERTLEKEMEAFLFRGKALIVYGPRQAGKTTAVTHLLAGRRDDVAEVNGDDADGRELLADCPLERLKAILGGRKILFVDEAQRIPGIGLTLKRAVDRLPGIQAIVSGSSSFELAGRTEEPLTGRKFEWTLLPFSFRELSDARSVPAEREALESRLVFGSYPEIVTEENARERRLSSLAESYLFRDLLTLQKIRRPELLDKILRAISHQCGSEVSYREIAALVGTDGKTVERYVELLEKSFVLFAVPSYSRNLRNELKRSRKVYFYDNGIRNAVIGDYRPLAARDDVGRLWENYLMSERLKWRAFRAPLARAYFWRTRQGQEVDLVEESAGGLAAFEFKWGGRGRARGAAAFRKAYPGASFDVVSRENYDAFLR